MANEHRSHSMDRELVSGERHEIEYLARTHGTSAENVEKLIAELGTRSRRRIEEALDQRYRHQSRHQGASNAGARTTGADGATRESTTKDTTHTRSGSGRDDAPK